MYHSVFIVGLHLQYMLLDTLQCLLWIYISIVNIVRCITVSLLLVYTYNQCCQMQCSGLYFGTIPKVNIVDALQSLMWVYIYSIYYQMHCSIYCGSVPIVNVVRCIAVFVVYTYCICCQMHCNVFIEVYTYSKC